ncbi:MAG: LysM peptidoglycan-binding domain-containing protein, partial [Pseudomonadota bacterium]
DLFSDVSDYWKKVHQRVLKGAYELNEEDFFVDEQGEWIFVPQKPLSSGAHQLSLEAYRTDHQGIISSIESEDIVVLVIPQDKITADAQGDRQNDNEGNQPLKQVDGTDDAPSHSLETETLAVAVSRDGAGQTRILQKPDEGELKDDTILDESEKIDPSLTLSNIDYSDDQEHIILSGRGSPNHKIQIYLDKALIATTIVGLDSQWIVVSEKVIATGHYKLRLDQILESQVVARVEFPFERPDQKQIDQQLGDQTVIVQPGNSLWRIARRTLGNGINYHILYQANRSQIRDPDLIYPGQVFTIPQQSPDADSKDVQNNRTDPQ